ncbi:MAG: hypothetical protein KC613_26130, partial [Myxococcales bacterium]|nr:hypothetical protein [Myxococcales bacterium]
MAPQTAPARGAAARIVTFAVTFAGGLLACTSAEPQGPCGGACVAGQTCVDDRCVWPAGADGGAPACVDDGDCAGGR